MRYWQHWKGFINKLYNRKITIHCALRGASQEYAAGLGVHFGDCFFHRGQTVGIDVGYFELVSAAGRRS